MPLDISYKGERIHTFADWERLAPPKGRAKQWVEGRSALECARAWTVPEPHVPAEIAALLGSHAATASATVRKVMPEHRIPFDRLGEPRNADVAAIADDAQGKIAITVEAKADESFDRQVSKVRASGQIRLDEKLASNAIKRIDGLLRSLFAGVGEEVDESLEALRYQLITGVAGTLAFAAEIGATRAVFIIHEFSTSKTKASRQDKNERDLHRFLNRLGIKETAGIGKLVGPVTVPGGIGFELPADLYIGKVKSAV